MAQLQTYLNMAIMRPMVTLEVLLRFTPQVEECVDSVSCALHKMCLFLQRVAIIKVLLAVNYKPCKGHSKHVKEGQMRCLTLDLHGKKSEGQLPLHITLNTADQS